VAEVDNEDGDVVDTQEENLTPLSLILAEALLEHLHTKVHLNQFNVKSVTNLVMLPKITDIDTMTMSLHHLKSTLHSLMMSGFWILEHHLTSLLTSIASPITLLIKVMVLSKLAIVMV
jgi:hypothetical protein